MKYKRKCLIRILIYQGYLFCILYCMGVMILLQL